MVGGGEELRKLFSKQTVPTSVVDLLSVLPIFNSKGEQRGLCHTQSLVLSVSPTLSEVTPAHRVTQALQPEIFCRLQRS